MAPKDGLVAAEIAGAKGHDALREVVERFSRRKSLLAEVPAEAKKPAWEMRWACIGSTVVHANELWGPIHKEKFRLRFHLDSMTTYFWTFSSMRNLKPILKRILKLILRRNLEVDP